MSATKPAAVKWIVVLAWVRLAIAACLIVIAIAFTSPLEFADLEHFRRGWIRGSGFDWETYGPEQAGEVTGRMLIPIILAVLMLIFVARRKLTGLRVAAAVSFVFSIPVPLTWPVTLTALVLASRESTKVYCLGTDGEPASVEPAARP